MRLLLIPISYLPHISRGWHPRVATLSNSEPSRNGIPCILRISPLSKYNKPPRSFLEIGRWDKDDRDFQVCHRGKWVEKQNTHTVCCQLSCTDFEAWHPIHKNFELSCHFLTQGSQGTPWYHIWLLPWWHWPSPHYSACPRRPPGPAAQVYYCFPSSYFLNWASLTQQPSTFPNAT